MLSLRDLEAILWGLNIPYLFNILSPILLIVHYILPILRFFIGHESSLAFLKKELLDFFRTFLSEVADGKDAILHCQ